MVTTSLVAEDILQQFRTQVRGDIIFPGEEGYEAARRVWNGMIDNKPALIVRAAGVADVIATVNLAREQDLLLSVRGGGHNVSGKAVADGGLMLDLSRLKGIRVDPEARTVRAQGGVTWGEFDHETQAFGLATTGGQVSSTGIAGLTLGGGIGNLMRKHGLTIDNLLSVDIVTADGRLLHASAHENEDLFWGVRGGGGNFGVVTSFEYRLHPVGPIVLGGLALYPAAQAPDLLRFFRDWAGDAPDEFTTTVMFLTAPPAPFVPEHLHFQPMVGVLISWIGGFEEGQAYIQKLRDFAPPGLDLTGPIPYVALQQIPDAGAPWGMHIYLKSLHLNGLSDEVIDIIVRHAAGITSPHSLTLINLLGGAVSRVGDDETAFGFRSTPFDMQIFGAWMDPVESDRHTAWVREFWEEILPHSHGVYVNELGVETVDRVREAYTPEAYERLVQLKNTYDPGNLFRHNQNIKPTV